jgi:hypothetical protein
MTRPTPDKPTKLMAMALYLAGITATIDLSTLNTSNAKAAK